MFQLSPSPRVRTSPYYEATLANGVTSFTPYNRMLLPTSYGDPEGEYWRLITGAQIWDVAAQRQVELAGRDAATLAQILCVRDLSTQVPGQGRYVALTDTAGTLINDPVLLKLDDDRFWLSIADSNIHFWASAIATERRLDVHVREPDVSPLAIQGPGAADVVAHIFGDWIRQIKFFWFQEAIIEGIPVLVSRSGWSKQGGFELFLLDSTKGTALWNVVCEAGRPRGIGPGAPNQVERTESGLLSFGADTDEQTNPFEVRMGRFVDLEVPDEVIGIHALRRIQDEGPRRRQLGVVLETAEPIAPNNQPDGHWHRLWTDGQMVGHMTNNVWSWRLHRNIGFGLVEAAAEPGSSVSVSINGQVYGGQLVTLPFIG